MFMKPAALIEIEIVWYKEQGDLSKCYACGDQMFLHMYVLNTEVKDKRQSTDVKLCESCYNAIIK